MTLRNTALGCFSPRINLPQNNSESVHVTVLGCMCEINDFGCKPACGADALSHAFSPYKYDVMVCYNVLYHIMLWCVMLCYDMSCHVMSCHVMSCHVMSCHIVVCYVMLWCVMLCCDVSCHLMLCCDVLCYVGLCHGML